MDRTQVLRRRAGRQPLLVFFAPSPSEHGGAQRRAALLAAGLVARGWRVLIVGRSTYGRYPSIRREGSL
ncbi:MAG TPA: hypothetical protein VFP55_13760, partial [Solirubrobacteraceae bacterium]|nr:hypothetical protein [Solirubrobacteraceae bacterium]